MKYKGRFIILLFSFFLACCNYKLLVDKRYVVHNQKGYLVFREDEAVFFPTKDTIDAKFLADKHKKQGYKVKFTTDWLDSLSADYSHLLFIKNDKRLSIIPVEIRNYLGVDWEKHDEENTIDYKWGNETHVLHYKIHDWRQILMISVVREIDRKRVKELPAEGTSPHP